MAQSPVPPIWVVSLKRSVDRRAFISSQLNILGLDYEMVDAVDGRELSPEAIAACYDPNAARKIIGRELTAAEVGCSLSHLRLYQRQVDEGHEDVLILEDDAVVFPPFIQVLARRAALPPDWEIVLFHRLNNPMISFWGRRPFDENHRCVKFAGIADGTCSYLLRLSGAKKLLSTGYPIRVPADGLTGGWVKTGSCLYALDPPPIREFSNGPTYSTMPENYALGRLKRPTREELGAIRWFRFQAERNFRRFRRRLNPNAIT